MEIGQIRMGIGQPVSRQESMRMGGYSFII